MTDKKGQVLFISSYPPRECGIATFTQDLIHGFDRMFNKMFDIKVCALQDDESVHHDYPEEVIAELNTAYPAQSLALAHEINNNEQIVAVVIEHEFGLFSGTYGENIFDLLDAVNKPVFICFHTVLSHPEPKLLEVVTRLATRATKLIVLTSHSRDVLRSDYGIDGEKVEIIPHGIHRVKPVLDKSALKAKFGFKDKIVLGTFGLISANKGIETALEAIAQLPQKEKVIYLVMGKTHPCVYRQEGEKYRDFLIAKTKELGIERQVLFINKYLELKELLTYLKLTDIYIFSSLDPKQTASGTLSYAMGSGCAVVSTPIPHAQELLADGAGITFDFGSSTQLTAVISDLIGNPEKLRETSAKAIRMAQSNAWENIAIRFATLISKYIPKEIKPEYALPPMHLDHFCRLTNRRGMVQFSSSSDPDLKSGYTTDDNARALYVLTLYNELYPNDPLVPGYFDVYLNFLQKTIQPDGRFLNYVDNNDQFTAQNHVENLEEANARAFVALSRFLQSTPVSYGLKMCALSMVLSFQKHVRNIRSPRPVAKLIKSLYFLDQYKKIPSHTALIHELSAELLRLYEISSEPEWEWFEPYLTYNNSVLPEGLMYAYLATNEIKYKKIAERSFNFLLSKMITGKRFRTVSNNGWLMQGQENVNNRFGEQPVEVACTIEALYLFYQATGEQRYKDAIHLAFSWFMGNNHLGQMVYNPATGGCHDGIEEFEVNINQGAESTLSYLVSRLTMDKLEHDERFIAELLALGEDRSIHKE